MGIAATTRIVFVAACLFASVNSMFLIIFMYFKSNNIKNFNEFFYIFKFIKLLA